VELAEGRIDFFMRLFLLDFFQKRRDERDLEGDVETTHSMLHLYFGHTGVFSSFFLLIRKQTVEFVR